MSFYSQVDLHSSKDSNGGEGHPLPPGKYSHLSVL